MTESDIDHIRTPVLSKVGVFDRFETVVENVYLKGAGDCTLKHSSYNYKMSGIYSNEIQKVKSDTCHLFSVIK